MNKILKQIGLLCILSVAVSAMEQSIDCCTQDSLEKFYSISSKLRFRLADSNAYQEIEREQALFFNIFKNYYGEYVTSNKLDENNLFEHCVQTPGVLDQIESNVLQWMYEAQREEKDDFDNLAIGIIDVRPEVKGESNYSIGIGLLISPSHVLTARHVLDIKFPLMMDGKWTGSYYENNKSTFWLCGSKEGLVINNIENLYDPIVAKTLDHETFEIKDTKINGIDIAVATLDRPNDLEYKTELSEDFPTNEDNLFCIVLEKNEENTYKVYSIPQLNILTYEFLKSKLSDKFQKKIFLEGYMIPGTSGSSLIASREGNKIKIYGVFNERVDVEVDGELKPIFAFTPLKDYVEKIKQIIKQ